MTALNATLPAVEFHAPADTLCRGCRQPADAAPGVTLCKRCQASEVISEAIRLKLVLIDLTDGNAPFDALTLDERIEQINSLGTTMDYARVVAIPRQRENRAKAAAHYAATASDEPSPAEREAIEELEETLSREATMDAEYAEQDAERWDTSWM